jgi:hypothetical protein
MLLETVIETFPAPAFMLSDASRISSENYLGEHCALIDQALERYRLGQQTLRRSGSEPLIGAAEDSQWHRGESGRAGDACAGRD